MGGARPAAADCGRPACDAARPEALGGVCGGHRPRPNRRGTIAHTACAATARVQLPLQKALAARAPIGAAALLPTSTASPRPLSHGTHGAYRESARASPVHTVARTCPLLPKVYAVVRLQTSTKADRFSHAHPNKRTLDAQVCTTSMYLHAHMSPRTPSCALSTLDAPHARNLSTQGVTITLPLCFGRMLACHACPRCPRGHQYFFSVFS